jgi:O-antigen/teichoic acid export membrane protein
MPRVRRSRPGTAGGVVSARADTPKPAAPDAAQPGFTPPSIPAGGLEALLFRCVELLSTTLLVVFTGRLMGPAGRGLYALASLTTLVLVLPLGPVWYGNVVEVTRGRLSLPEIFGGSIVIATVGGIVTALVALGFSVTLGDRWWIVAAPAGVTPFLLLMSYQEGLFMGMGHVRAVNLLRIARAVLPLLFIAPALLAGAPARTAIEIWLLSFIVIALATSVPLRAYVGRPRLPRDRAYYRRVVTYGGKISGLNAVDAANDRVGLLALAVFRGDAAVGVFSIAIAGLQVLLTATQALALSTFRRIGTESPAASAALTARTVRHAILLTSAGILVLVPASFVAVPLALGKGYEDVPVLLLVLVADAIYLAALYPLYTYFQVQATKPATLLKVGGSALLANVALTAALAPHWGIWGVAVAATLAGTLQFTVALRSFGAEAGVSLRDVVPGRPELADYVWLAATLRRRSTRTATGDAGR